MVACAGVGYANHAEVVSVPENLCVKFHPDADVKYNTLGAIAMQGVRQGRSEAGGKLCGHRIRAAGAVDVPAAQGGRCEGCWNRHRSGRSKRSQPSKLNILVSALLREP